MSDNPNPKKRDDFQHRELTSVCEMADDLLKDVVSPTLDATDAVYEGDDLVDLLLIMAGEQVSAATAAKINSDRLAQQSGQTDSDGSNEPSSGTLLARLRNLSVTEITEMVNHGVEAIVDQMTSMGAFTDPVDIAVDIIEVPYYGDPEEADWVMAASGNTGANYCIKFATATIAGENQHLVIGMVPLYDPTSSGEDDSLGRDTNSYQVRDIVQDLMEQVTDLIDVRCVLADREFATAGVITALEEIGVDYIISAPRNSRVRRWLDHVFNEEDTMIASNESTIYLTPSDSDSSLDPVPTSLVGERNSVNGDEGPLVARYTNSDHYTGTPPNHMVTKNRLEQRWQSVDQVTHKIRDISLKSSSSVFSVRYFGFGLAVLLCDLWLLSDARLRRNNDRQIQSGPELSAERFLYNLQNCSPL